MDKKLKSGITILSISLLFSINPWFWFFTCPFVLFGIIKIWRSDVNWNLKAIWTFVPFIVWLPLIIAFVKIYLENKSY